MPTPQAPPGEGLELLAMLAEGGDVGARDLAEATAHVARDQRAWLTGASSATSALAQAIVAGHQGRVVVVWAGGCLDGADLVRTLGFALRLPVPGESAAVSAALGQEPHPLVVLLGAPTWPDARVLDDLGALAPDLSVVVTGPPIDPRGSPLHAPEPVVSSAQGRPWPRELAPGPALQALLHLPGGLPASVVAGVPREATAPLGPGDDSPRILHPALRATLPPPDPHERPSVARWLVERRPSLLTLGLGAPFSEPPTPVEVLLARFVAGALADPGRRALALATAVRLLVCVGQPEVARGLVAGAREVLRQPDDDVEALLWWAEADAWLAAGVPDQSDRCFRRALEHLRLLGDRRMQLACLRARFRTLALHGRLGEAQEVNAEARSLLRASGDARGVATTLRLDGDLAVGAGEVVSAGVLYEQAATVLEADLEAPPSALAALRLGLASLALGRGELATAERLLDAADGAVTGPVQTLLVQRRRAELRLRQGRHAEAITLLEPLIPALHGLGEHAVAARTVRLLADMQAATGRRQEAARGYASALEESARRGDLRGATRVLVHWRALEAEGADSELVEELDRRLALVQAIGAPAPT